MKLNSNEIKELITGLGLRIETLPNGFPDLKARLIDLSNRLRAFHEENGDAFCLERYEPVMLMLPCSAEDIEWLTYRQIQAQMDTGTKSRLEVIAQSILKEARLAELMAKQAEEKK